MKLTKFFTVFILLCLFLGQGFLSKRITKPPILLSKEMTAINFEGEFAKILNLGHGRLLGAITWVITLLEGDIEHYKNDHGNSWMFYRFLSISHYDPLFYENYRYGGQYLSIVKDDLNGAEIIFDRGLQHYPNDFWLNYHAGFNSYFEKRDFKKGVKYFEKIIYDPLLFQHFPLLPSLLAKMKTKEGEEGEAFKILKKLYDEMPDNHKKKENIKLMLYSLKAKRDLRCLNNGEGGCERFDFEGNPYKNEKGLYRANRDLLNLTIHLK